MKKQTLYLIINASLMLIIGIAMSLFISMNVDKEAKDLLFDQNIELKNNISIESPSGSSYSIIDYKQYAVDEDGKTIGIVYNVKIKNSFYDSRSGNDYGYIELLVGIKDENTVSKLNDTMYVEIVTLEQTETYSPKIQAYVYEVFQNINYQQIQNAEVYNAKPDAEIVAGATEVVTSTGAIKELLIRTFQDYLGIVVDPYQEVLGEGYVIEEDTLFTKTTHVTNKQNITTSTTVSNGYIYTVTASGDYQDYDQVKNGPITLWVIFDESGKVYKILFDENTYGHSEGYMNKNLEYLDEFIGKTMAEFPSVISDNSDLKTGASGSRALIDIILSALKDEVA